MRRARGAVLFAVTLAACVALLSGSRLAIADERSAPQLMVDRVLSAQLPNRDPRDLAERLRAPTAPSPSVTSASASASASASTSGPPALAVGDADTFWILDQRTAQLFQTRASLRLVTQHAYWFVQSDMLDRAPQTDLEQSATVFEHKTYPLIHRYFGSEPTPGFEDDAHIVFLLANVPGVAAYFSSADVYPRSVNPRSNERDMIYVNLSSLHPGQMNFDATLTHEMQHMVSFAHCPSQEGWLDEGASELAMRVGGYDSGAPAAFAAHPDVQLTAWTDQASDLTRHYQASYLFLRYVAERAGGWDALPDILGSCSRGESLFANYLSRNPLAPDVEMLFSDWSVANLLQDASVADGRFAYAGNNFHVALTGRATPYMAFLGSVPQYAANYVELPSAAGSMTFAGDASVALLPVDVDSSGVWWANRGDNLDSKLTRQVDLSGVDRATVQFSAWYDVESQFDFVYLSASRDEGRTWQVLHARHTTPDRAAGNSYGEGWSRLHGWRVHGWRRLG